MARPLKKRRICALPRYAQFCPRREDGEAPLVRMPVDEFETIRLMDYHGMTQQECAEQLGVARTTVQMLYTAARKRLAACLVEGRPLVIAGGSYELCEKDDACGCLHRQPRQCPYGQEGMISMKLAITYDNGQIFQHFGKTEAFKVYTIENGQITESHVLESNGAGHGALATLLQNESVDTLICGGIGAGAQNALAQAGIRLYGGVQGNADDAAQALIEDRLAYDPAVHCDHHGQHDSGHTCDDHGQNGGHGPHGHQHGQHGQHGNGHTCGHHGRK